jgi:uncharacterized protein (TIGR00369 family)
MPDLDILQARLDRTPFNAWLGIRLISGGGGQAELQVPWRPEFVSTPELQATHGGVLASLVDVACVFALTCDTGNVHATVDLRIDYHARAVPGPFRAFGTVIRAGRSFSTSEARVLDADGRLVASGRGLFIDLGLAA